VIVVPRGLNRYSCCAKRALSRRAVRLSVGALLVERSSMRDVGEGKVYMATTRYASNRPVCPARHMK